jgi:hypothetical protein
MGQGLHSKMIQIAMNISLKNNGKTIHLGKIYKLDKNAFWKAIKKHKTKKKNNYLIKNTGLDEFEKYYEMLFSHEWLLDSEEHILIKNSVKKYYSNNKDKKFDIIVS